MLKFAKKIGCKWFEVGEICYPNHPNNPKPSLKDLGISDSDVRNWIRLSNSADLVTTAAGMTVYDRKLGSINPHSIRRFGFRRLEPISKYWMNMSKSKKDATGIKHNKNYLTLANALLSVWNHSNERFISGTLTMGHRPDIRIGYRLDYTTEVPLPFPSINAGADGEGTETNRVNRYQFYITGVSHNLNYLGRNTTTLTVVRGSNLYDSLFQDPQTPESLKARGITTDLGGAEVHLSELLQEVDARAGGTTILVPSEEGEESPE